MNVQELTVSPQAAGLDGATREVPAGVCTSLSALSEGHRKLFRDSAEQSFFLSLPWFQNFCENALDPGDELRMFFTNGESGSPRAGLLARYQPAAAGPLAPRTLSGLSNFYTSLYAPLLSDPTESPAAQQALNQLAAMIRAEKPHWDTVDLKWLDAKSWVFEGLQRAFRSAGMLVQTYFCTGNWYTPVAGMSYQQYLETLRSSVRNIARSKNKKIERSGRARVDIVTSERGLEEAMEAYGRIYAASWKVPEPYTNFIPGLVRMSAEQGWLRLGVVYIDGEPAASQLWIVSQGIASIYKIAYDKRFADLSVGSFLTSRMMEHVLEVDKVREIDYLTGDDKYKQDWMSHRRERWGILAMNPRTLKGALAVARHVGGRATKRMMQSVLARFSREKKAKPAPSVTV